MDSVIFTMSYSNSNIQTNLEKVELNGKIFYCLLHYYYDKELNDLFVDEFLGNFNIDTIKRTYDLLFGGIKNE